MKQQTKFMIGDKVAYIETPNEEDFQFGSETYVTDILYEMGEFFYKTSQYPIYFAEKNIEHYDLVNSPLYNALKEI